MISFWLILIRKIIVLYFCFFSFILKAQQDSIAFEKSIDKPNPSILAIHPFGIFSSRINQNFKTSAPKHTTLTLTHASSNNFHPFVEIYIPKDPLVQKQQSELTWYHRNFQFIDQETTPADYMNIVIDAVIKEFRFKINIPLNNTHELDIALRSYLITKGKYPFSLFTSDETIEWFHSNIAGGEDPYGRMYYGLNQVNFKYTDRYGKVLELHNNDFFISGIELNHFYYPSFLINKKKNLYFNFGSHLGINISRYNPSLDLGISANAVKKIVFKNNNELHLGAGASLLRKNLIKFDDAVDLGNNPYLGSAEGNIEFIKYTIKKNYNAFGVTFHIQSSYNKLKEADYYRLIGKWKEINGGWQHGFSTLYRALTYWTLLYTYAQPKYSITLYFKEDLDVNNAPDIQTGISLNIPISK